MKFGKFSQGLGPPTELVARYAAAVAGEEVVHAQANLDQESAAFLGLALLVGEEAHGCRQDAGERAEDRDGGLQWLHVVGGAIRRSLLRSTTDSWTKRNSPFSRYRIPPWIMWEEAPLAPWQ